MKQIVSGILSQDRTEKTKETKTILKQQLKREDYIE